MMASITGYHQWSGNGSLAPGDIKIIVIDLIGQLHHLTGFILVRLIIARKIHLIDGLIPYMAETTFYIERLAEMMHHAVHLLFCDILREDLEVLIAGIFVFGKRQGH